MELTRKQGTLSLLDQLRKPDSRGAADVSEDPEKVDAGGEAVSRKKKPPRFSDKKPAPDKSELGIDEPVDINATY